MAVSTLDYPDSSRLSAAEESRLAKLIERGDLGAKDRMIQANLRLVLSLARDYRGRGVPFGDLVQEGTIGLVRAVERFDHRRELKFSTYAVWWIRRSLLDAIAGAEVIRIPPKANQRLAAVRRAEFELANESHRPPTTPEIAHRTGLSPRVIRSLQATPRVTTSLDESVGDNGIALREMVADPTAVNPIQRIEAHEARRDLAKMLTLLPMRHREVLVRRYGLGGRTPQAYHEIGESFGVSEERTRQIEQEALRRLRSIVGKSSLAD